MPPAFDFRGVSMETRCDLCTLWVPSVPLQMAERCWWITDLRRTEPACGCRGAPSSFYILCRVILFTEQFCPHPCPNPNNVKWFAPPTRMVSRGLPPPTRTVSRGLGLPRTRTVSRGLGLPPNPNSVKRFAPPNPNCVKRLAAPIRKMSKGLPPPPQPYT